MPDVQVNAVTTWYYANCTTSLGLGDYVVNVAPAHGVFAFGTLSAPVPGCPAGSPPLPAAVAYYTWTDTNPAASTDYFQLFFELNGSDAETIDISVVLAAPACTITSQTLATVPGIDNSRTTVGIGEWVELTSNVPVTWSANGGLLSEAATGDRGAQCSPTPPSGPIVGTQACFTAPDSNQTVTVTATLPDSSSCSTAFTVEQPTGLIFERVPYLTNPQKPDYFLQSGLFYAMGMLSAVFLTPGDVSFQNIMISEHDTPKPYGFAPTNLLFALPSGNGQSTNAWFYRCDKDFDYGVETPDPKQSYWVFNYGGVDTPFSLVQTEWSHPLFGGYQYSKGQIEALSADGTFVATPGVPAATLTLPGDASSYYNFVIPPEAACQAAVESQFTAVTDGITHGLAVR